jgi:hypothetical protein
VQQVVARRLKKDPPPARAMAPGSASDEASVARQREREEQLALLELDLRARKQIPEAPKGGAGRKRPREALSLSERFPGYRGKWFDETNCKEAYPSSYIGEDEAGWFDVSHQPAFVVGANALKLRQHEPYRARYPIRDGYFNLNGLSIFEGGYVSKQEVCNDLEAIWRSALRSQLGVAGEQINSYAAVLVVPDIFHKQVG